MLSTNASELKKALSQLNCRKFNMLIGVDGFVDQIIQVVGSRRDVNNYESIQTIKEFSERLGRAAGLSTNVELVAVQTKLGGNGPIYANALLNYDNEVSYFGCLGKPKVHPVFSEMTMRCKNVYSIAEPGYSDALEFMDGKLIFGKHESLKEVTWEAVRDALGGAEKMAELISNCDLFGLENWTMLPYMSQIWQGLIDEVFPKLTLYKKPYAFFDIADPEKRVKEDILHALTLISKFEEKFRAVLGLNEKELFEIAEVYDIPVDNSLPRYELLKTTAEAVYEKLKIYALVVHPTKEALAVVEGEFFYTEGPFCEKPVLTTGAGDNFNAGFCYGLVLGLSPLLALTMGVCTSGYYVRNAKSPSFDEVVGFLGSL